MSVAPSYTRGRHEQDVDTAADKMSLPEPAFSKGSLPGRLWGMLHHEAVKDADDDFQLKANGSGKLNGSSKGFFGMARHRSSKIRADNDHRVYGNESYDNGPTAADQPQQPQQHQRQPQQEGPMLNNLVNKSLGSTGHSTRIAAARGVDQQQQQGEPATGSGGDSHDDAHAAATAAGADSLASSSRGPSLLAFFRRSPNTSPNSTLRAEDVQSGTLVRAFHEEAEHEAADRATTASAAHSQSHGRSLADWEAEIKGLLRLNRSEAIQAPAPSIGMIRCYVRRTKTLLGQYSSFKMYLESGDVFLLAARQRKKSKKPSYIISLDDEDLKRDTENNVAKLKSNLVGTEFRLWSRDAGLPNGTFPVEDAAITFQPTIGKQSGPRVMHVMMPVPESGWQPSAADGSDTLLQALKLAQDNELPPSLNRLALLATKAPEWSSATKSHTLDFQGRIKETSAKNFQMTSVDPATGRRGNDVLLQFGKMDASTFALDFAYPMTIKTAFAAALAAVDSKLCCTI